MSFEAELKKFELSSVFTINFSWLKRYVESDNGMYTPMKNISDDEFREIENSLYALQATWKAWREAKAQAVPEWIETAIQPPEEGQKVIISGIYGVGMAEFSYLYKDEAEFSYLYKDEFVMYDMGASNPILSKDQVKFWMPLPDAPQEPAND